jgi:hypothetical protein
VHTLKIVFLIKRIAFNIPVGLIIHTFNFIPAKAGTWKHVRSILFWIPHQAWDDRIHIQLLVLVSYISAAEWFTNKDFSLFSRSILFEDEI